MKKILLTLVSILALSMPAAAQTMSDSQIIEFVQKEQSKGTSQAQIVTKLMQKGVSVTKLQQLRKKYASMQKNSLGGADKISAQDRGRVNNGRLPNDMRQEETLAKERTLGVREYASDNMMRGTHDDELKMRDALNDLMPDSLTMLEQQIEERLKNAKKVFGRDIFNNKELTFEPNMNIATPQHYRLGPGDAVYIDIYGGSQKTVEAVVSPDGTVTIEGYGPVYVAGLTVDEANARLRSTLGSRYASSKIQLTVGQTRTIMVNVMGEVKTPGTYTLSAFATVFHALYMAGGISDIGTLRNIKVYRQGRLVSQVDVYDYILNGKLTGNVRLTDNDVIVVGPYDCLVNITGKVKRPMYYEMKKSESMQTLMKYAGGFTNDAYRQTVRVIRKTGKQYSVFNVTEFDMNSFHVNDGDSVAVDSILPRYENMVEVKGAVFRPGMYQLGGEVTSVRSLLTMCDGVTEEAFTAHAVMHRLKKDRTLEVLSVDVEGIMNGSVTDIPLKNEDVLFIPTKRTMMEEQTITIHGEVQFPGIYKYADNETIEDFVIQAGGLKESASVMKVDVSRRVKDFKALTTDSIIAQTFSFELKDGFVIDGQPGFVLQPFDEVYVRKSPNYTKQQNVYVEGEVNFAGTYTLPKRETRLSEIIRLAGGLNNEAYPAGARLERVLTDDERARVESMMKAARVNSGGSDSIDVKKLDIGDKYFVGIELDKALASPGSGYDILLREGDRLIIPEFNATVKINGAVMYPNTISFTAGKSASWYVERAGGYASRAKRTKTYIVHQNGMVEKLSRGSKITPGCEIVVPEKVKKEKNTAGTAMLISALSALATVGAVLVSAFKK